MTDRSRWLGPLAGAAVVVTMVTVLRAMGRIYWCACGSLVPWSFDTWSRHNSQHLIDPYLGSHVLHGLIFYALFRLALGVDRTTLRLLGAMVLEAAWEIAENTPMVIDRYREGTASLDYTGDSIANSVSDLAACVAGYVLASRAPVWVTVTLGIVTELVMLAWIRDNLTLNVIMLVWPIEAIKQWQVAGAPM